MKIGDIAYLNLKRRKAKAAFMLAGLVAGVATMVALVGLTRSLTEEVTHKLEKYGANILITPQSQSLSLSYEGLSLGGVSFETKEIEQASLSRLAGIKNAANLAAVGPMVLGPVNVNGKKVLLGGVDFNASRMLKAWWKVNGRQPGKNEILAGSSAAGVLGLKPGEELGLKGQAFTVSGILEPTGSQDDDLLFTRLDVAQGLLGKQGKVHLVEVAALCKDCPVDDMVGQISQALPGVKVTAIQSVVKGRMQALSQLKRISLGVAGLVALVGSLVVLVTMMAAVRERTGEIGVFRAIGFRKGQIMRIILAEAAIISAAAGLLGWLAGMAASAGALPFLSKGAPAKISLDPWLAAAAMGMALLVGIASSVYPAVTAARMDPARALRSL